MCVFLYVSIRPGEHFSVRAILLLGTFHAIIYDGVFSVRNFYVGFCHGTLLAMP
jgi:hypothetical protein